MFKADGQPTKPSRMFVHLRREYVKDKNFDRAQTSGKQVSIPVRVNKGWAKLRGTVEGVKDLPTGKRIDMRPTPGSFLQDWANMHIWIPKEEGDPVGVLMPS